MTQSTMKTGLLNRSWEVTQIKVFGRWCAKHLRTRGIVFENLEKDFSDGVKLINLLEVIGKEKMDGRWHQVTKNRFQMLENVQLAIHYISDIKKIKLIGIHPEDIVDCNLKLTLGMIWSCINKFVIEDISVEEATARDALLIWCKKNTQGYEEVSIANFTTSWSSGLAFCALVNHFRPDLLDYNALDRSNHTQNCITAFEACNKLGITVFLDPEDLVDTTPDDKSVVTQVSEFFHFFAGESKTIAMADKIKNTIAIQKLLAGLTGEYERQAQATVDAINSEHAQITSTDYEKNVPGVKNKLVDVVKFGRVGRPNIVELRSTALKTWASLVTNCKSHSRAIPTPKAGLEPEALDASLTNLENVQAETRQNLTNELHDLENSLINAFDAKCNDIKSGCQDVRGRADNLSGSLHEQRETLKALLEEANGFNGRVDDLQPPYYELCQLGLNTRTENTTYSVRNEVDQLIAHLSRLIDQNKALIIQEENEAKISAYNAKAQPYVDECHSIEESFSSISGSVDERRDALLAKQQEITTKREGVKNLYSDYEALEHDGLHLGIVNTPAAIESSYSKCLTTAIVDTNKVFDEMVANFDQLTAGIEQQIREVNDRANALSGSFSDQKTTIEGLIDQAKQIEASIPTTLDGPYEQIKEFKLQWRVNRTPNDVNGSVDQLLTLLIKLQEQNKSNLVKEANEAQIAQYNSLAAIAVEASHQFRETVKAIDQNSSDIADRRSQFLAKLQELAQKREELTALNEPYQALERSGLHLEIVATPSSISSYYAQTLTDITNTLNEIYSQMVSNYDSKALNFVDQIKGIDQKQKSLGGSAEERKSAIEELTNQLRPIEGSLDEVLNSPYEELTQFKLNYRVKYSPNDVHNIFDQSLSQLQHLEKSLEGEIIKQSNAKRVAEYNEKAKAILDSLKALEASVAAIDGSHEEKQKQLYAKGTEANAKFDQIGAVTQLFEDLEKDALHLDIEDSPSSITTFINTIVSHIETVISEIDKAIAAAKGLEISEEQLQEFRETFSHFDKDGTRTLQTYELVACLTAIGDSISEPEAKAIIAKYSPGKTDLDFDSYVRFMLDRYSKKETPESTKEAFAAIAANQPIINDDQLARYFSPEDVEYLKTQLKPVDGGYDFASWVDSIYQ